MVRDFIRPNPANGDIKMSDKLTKKAKIEIDREWEILQKVNVTNPSKADKDAYYKLKKEKPDIFNGITTLLQSNRDFILNRRCSFLVVEKVKDELRRMRDNLGWETASELEKLLIEQVCVNYVRTALLEKDHEIKTTESHTHDAGLYWEKRLDTAHKRYMRTLETLAKVRKLTAEADLKAAKARNKQRPANELMDSLKGLPALEEFGMEDFGKSIKKLNSKAD